MTTDYLYASSRCSYNIAHAAGWDAGNRLQKELGLTEWDDRCVDKAAETFHTIYTALGMRNAAY